MKRTLSYLILFIFICFITSIAFAGNLPLKGNNLMETKIGTIKLFDKKRTVYQRLGKPIKTTFERTSELTDVYYKDLRIGLDSRGYVIEIESTSIKFPVYRGIKIGDKKSKIVQRYGKPTNELNGKNQKYLQYNSTIYQGWLYCIRFYIFHDKVTKISVFDPWGIGL